MAIEFQDVLKTSIVLLGANLLNEQPQRDQFAGKVGTEVDVEALISGLAIPLPGMDGSPNVAARTVIHLRRDRTHIDIQPGRTVIEREYPTYDSLDRMTEVVDLAISSTNLEDQDLTAFGVNIELVYRHTGEEPAEMYLVERLFPRQRYFMDGLTPVSGIAQVIYEGLGARWTFTSQPRANDPTGQKLFLGINRHVNSQLAPNAGEIYDAFQQVWNRSREFALQLDGST